MRIWLLLGSIALVGCTGLRPEGEIVRGASDGGVDGNVPDAGPDCIDPTGFGGAGCYRCTPSSRDQLLNACTSASTEPFDESTRLPAIPDGGVMLPTPMDGGMDGGMPSDAGTIDGGTGDAGTGPRLCSSLPNPIYVTGSSAVALFLGQVAHALENDGTPVTVVSKSSASCTGVASMVSPASAMLSGTAIYWDPSRASIRRARPRSCHAPV